MTSAELKKKVLALGPWEFWLERHFPPFIVSIFVDGSSKQYIKKIGIDKVELKAMLYQNNTWYKDKTFNTFVSQIDRFEKNGGSIKKVIKSCENYWTRSKKQIEKINKLHIVPTEKLKQVYEVITEDVAYVWITNGSDQLYEQKLRKEVPKYFKGDIDKFIGDASYPTKKNAHHFFEAALRSSRSLASIQKEFGWIKVRDGFSDPFTISELAKERSRLKKEKHTKFTPPAIPKQLKPLFKTVQELVYMRTLRSDIFHNLVFLARPTLMEVAKQYRIPFKELKDYSALDLIAGTPKKYSKDFSFIWLDKEYAFFNTPLFKDDVSNITELPGKIANMGKASGVAKIVKTAQEIDKVTKGDILFAPTTAPSYILGMKKAAAFVTDEGGITSHAAIVSREMNKPCIIGTKIGTKAFKDGDKVEVDANKGIVRLIK